MSGILTSEPPVSARVGPHASREILINPAALRWEYFARKHRPNDSREMLAVDERGLSGLPPAGTLNVGRVLALTQTSRELRRTREIDGRRYPGKDTQAPARNVRRGGNFR